MAALRAVLFDLGGTLWEWRPGLTVEAMLATVAPAAIRLLPPEQAELLTPEAVAVAVRHAYLALEDEACAGEHGPIPAARYVMRGLETLGVGVESDTALAMLAALYVPETRTTRLLQGVPETLQALHTAGLRLGIISNRMHGGTLLLDDLSYFGISHYFATMITSCDSGYMKPSPMLFQQALGELGVEPAEALMVGDDLCADIGGALGMGMRAIWVRRPPTRTDEPPPGVSTITSMNELPTLLGIEV